MSPVSASNNEATRRFPRVSGDEPVDAALTPGRYVFSPRERG